MDDFEPLPDAALTMMRLRSGAVIGLIGVLLVVFAALAASSGANLVAVVSSAVLLVVIGVWWVFVGMVFRSYSWRLTPDTVELRHGVVVQRHEVLPRARVQNVTTSSGPVARLFGLVAVVVHSAGANTPNLTVPDMAAEAADGLRSSLLPSTVA